MLSDRLEHAKRKNPELADLLELMGAYVLRQDALGEPYIIPRLAGAALDLTDGESFVLLEALASAGAIERAFNVYCKVTNRYLTTARTIEELDGPNFLDRFCDECGREHGTRDLRVELAFTVIKSRTLVEAA